jgi:hypothetical protein
MELDPAGIRPGVERPPGELGAVVADEPRRQRAFLRQPLEHADHAEAEQRAVDLDGDRLAGRRQGPS